MPISRKSTNSTDYKLRAENQIDATECFIAIIICSTCFRHSYAHHQELETTLVLLLHMVCNALVAGGQLLGVEQQAMHPGRGKLCTKVKMMLLLMLLLLLLLILLLLVLWLLLLPLPCFLSFLIYFFCSFFLLLFLLLLR